MITQDPTVLFAGITDILVGVILLYTETALPETVGLAHSIFLIYKGVASIIVFIPLGGMPVYILGNFADVLSAALLYFGEPPILTEYKNYLAVILFFKGTIGIITMLAA